MSTFLTTDQLRQLRATHMNSLNRLREASADWDAKTALNKTANILEIVSDNVGAGIVQVRFSDDDYTNWSEYRDIDLNQYRSMSTEWGTFRRRAHHLRQRDDCPLRIEAIDLHVDLGTL
mgnify:CR=1 FL=1